MTTNTKKIIGRSILGLFAGFAFSVILVTEWEFFTSKEFLKPFCIIIAGFLSLFMGGFMYMEGDLNSNKFTKYTGLVLLCTPFLILVGIVIYLLYPVFMMAPLEVGLVLIGSLVLSTALSWASLN